MIAGVGGQAAGAVAEVRVRVAAAREPGV